MHRFKKYLQKIVLIEIEKMKIYTKKGDTGTTALVGGKKIRKDDLLVEAYGTCDELSVAIGQLIALSPDPYFTALQNHLFLIGGAMATEADNVTNYWNLESLEQVVREMEGKIDTLSEELPPFAGFVLPQGSATIAQIHQCRVVTRRLERAMYRANLNNEVFSNVFQFINRLSDYFFVLSRYYHLKEGVTEVCWKK